MQLARQINYRRGMANAYHLLGMLSCNQSNYDKALEYYLASLKIDKEIGNKPGLSISYNNIGLVYWNQGNYEKALKYYLISLNLDEELGDQKGMASSYNNVGLIYWGQSNFDKALEYFQRAISLHSILNDKKGMAGGYSNIGGVNYYKGHPDLAIQYFKKSYDMYESIHYLPGCATAATNISEILTEQKKYSEALIYGMNALKIQRELGSKSDVAYSLLALAKNYSSQHDYSKAIELLKEAAALAKEIRANKQLSQAYLDLAAIYARQNNYKEAYSMHQLYSEVSDSIYTNESAAQIAEMNTKYESEKKNREIDILKKEKEIQQLTQSSEKSKNVIIRNSLLIGLTLILLLAILLFNRNQVKQRANIALAQKNKNIEEQKTQIEFQHGQLELKNKEITDSINYARNLQLAILPPDQQVRQLLPESFILYKPKDIVSGDFYWLEQWGDKILVAAADCTGHGVPGAFMSIVGNNLLQQAVNNYGLSKPFLILNNLNKQISKMLHQTEEASTVKDGMDIALISIDQKERKVEFAGAYNSLWLIRDNDIREYPADKHPIGAFIGEELKQFSHHEFQYQPGDRLYIFTDGYADQFGGTSGKKLKYKNFRSLILEYHQLPMSLQREKLLHFMDDWKGNLEQIDDMLIIGIQLA